MSESVAVERGESNPSKYPVDVTVTLDLRELIRADSPEEAEDKAIDHVYKEYAALIQSVEDVEALER